MAYKLPGFENMIHRVMEEWKVPGLALAVIEGDEIYTKVGLGNNSMASFLFPTFDLTP